MPAVLRATLRAHTHHVRPICLARVTMHTRCPHNTCTCIVHVWTHITLKRCRRQRAWFMRLSGGSRSSGSGPAGLPAVRGAFVGGLQERQSIGQHAQLPQLACARGADRPSRRCAIGAGTLPAWALALQNRAGGRAFRNASNTHMWVNPHESQKWSLGALPTYCGSVFFVCGSSPFVWAQLRLFILRFGDLVGGPTGVSLSINPP